MTEMGGVPGAGQASAPQMGAFARLINVFFSPAKTFEAIAAKPGWVLPVVILIAFTLVASFAFVGKIDVGPLVDQQVKAMEKQGRSVDEAGRERLEASMKGFMKFQPIIGGLWVAAQIFLVPAIWFGIASAWGRGKGYAPVLSAYAHIQLVALVKGALTWIVAIPKDKLDPESIPTLLKSSVGSFLSKESVPAALHAILNNVDVFELWMVALGVLALRKTTRLSTKGAAATVVGLWLVWVVLSASFAAIGAALRG